MRAGLLGAVGRIEIAETELPAVAADEALIELRSVGICGSDMHAFRGHHPFRKPPVILGHEGAGRIARAVPGGRLTEGARVAIMPVQSCWTCPRCEDGLSHLCAHKRVPGAGWQGLMAEYVTAPERVLFELPDSVGYDEGAMIEPVAVAWHTTRVAGVTAGQSVAVLGAGAIGALVAAVCRLHRVRTLVVSDIRERSLLVAGKLTGCHTVDAARTDVVGEARGVLEGEGFDVVVIASGHPTCLDEAIAMCRPRGTVVVLPMFGDAINVGLNPVVLNEIVIKGLTIYTPADFRAAADAVCERRLDVRPLLGTMAPLTGAQSAFEALDNGSELIKLQLDPTR